MNMPIYEYKCQSCGQVVELLQRIGEPGPDSCPSCGGAMKRLLSQTSFILNGSGWYVTDYGYKKDLKEKSGSKPKKETTKSSSSATK